jgi:poly-gamma-glutamate system protein
MAKNSLTPHKNLLISGLFFLSIAFFLLAKIFPYREAAALREEMISASKIMSEAMEVVKECREAKKYPMDPSSDVNRTGIIGLKSSSITTSLGSLEAKRTSANPNFAGAVVLLLRRAGVGSGDIIAVGASGSFPALILAVLSAAKAMDLEPLVLTSLGASQWGANNPDFHWLHMQACLHQNGILIFEPIGVSMGGNQDTGGDMREEGRSILRRDMEEAGFPIISESDLKANVEFKMQLYFQKASGKKIKAFVNIGGSWSNLGTDSEILHLRPGLEKIKRFPPEEKRGILYAMAARGIPVIHLLYVRGFVERNGLPWDPVPLPRPGEGKIYQRILETQKSFLIIAVAYLVSVSIGMIVFLRAKKST